MKKFFVFAIIAFLILNVPIQLGTQLASAQTVPPDSLSADSTQPAATTSYSQNSNSTILHSGTINISGTSKNLASHLQNQISSPNKIKPYHSKDDKALSDEKQKMSQKKFSALRVSPRLAGATTLESRQVTSSLAFDGLNMIQSGGSYPPDVQIAAGPNNIMEMVNLEGEIFHKDGTSVSTFTLQSFYGASGFLSDPKILYDSISQRWFASLTNISTNSVLFAVSTTSDPTSPWRLYSLPVGNCADQPIIGINDNKFVISVNIFSNKCGVFGGISTFLGAQYFVLDKSGLVAGSPSVSYQASVLDTSSFSIHPVQSLSSTPGPNFPLYMVSVDMGSPGLLHLFTINGAVPSVSVAFTDFNINPVGMPPPAVQPGTSTTLDTGDSRIEDAKWFKGNLWLTFTDACIPTGDSTPRSCLHLAEIYTVSPSVIQDFYYGSSGFYYFYPALAQDVNGNLDLIYGFSSSSAYPSLAVTGRAVGDPPNTLQSPLTIKSGQVSDLSGRYGDFFGAAVDPSNPTVVWVNGEYHSSSLSNPSINWATFIAQTSLTQTSVNLDSLSLTDNLITAKSRINSFLDSIPVSDQLSISHTVTPLSTTVLLSVYNSRPDLKAAFPEAAGGNLVNLIKWAATFGITIDSDSPTLLPYSSVYVLENIYNKRPDLKAAFPEAAGGNLVNLINWAATSGITIDGTSSKLSPYASMYVLENIYNKRPDLKAAFPEAAGGNLVNLINWAATSGITIDGASSKLSPYASMYVLENIYNKRPDLKAAFPEAVGYGNLVKLINWAATSGITIDGTKPTLLPYAPIYVLENVYDHRVDLMTAFPNAGNQGNTDYHNLICWAMNTGITTDVAKPTLLPYASYYTSHC